MRSGERLKPAVQAKKKSAFFRKEGEGDFFGGQQQQGHFFTGKAAGKGGKGVVQKKLRVGPPGDVYEKEADGMAEKVVQKCAHCEAEERKAKGKGAGAVEGVQRKPIFESKNEPKEEEGMLRRQCSACAAAQAEGGVSPAVESKLKASKGGGSPLPASERQAMEAGFGADFGSVRIHHNDGSAKMSEELGAHAFTHGNDIYFNTGKYDMGSNDGRQLLAHELTHTIQQGKGAPRETLHKDDDPDAASGGSAGGQAGQQVQNGSGQQGGAQQDILQFDSLDELAKELKNLNESGDLVQDDNKKKAEAKRKKLLIEAEIKWLKGQGQEAHAFDSEDAMQNYVGSELERIDTDAGNESATISVLSDWEALSVDSQSFYLHPYFSDKMDAFPDAYVQLLTPLVQPPVEEGLSVNNGMDQAQSSVNDALKELPAFLYESGLPVSFERSKTLTAYELIKSRQLDLNLFSLLKIMPHFAGDLAFAFEPEETNLHKGPIGQFQNGWVDYIINEYQVALFAEWMGRYRTLKSQIEEGDFKVVDPGSLARFKNLHPDGLGSISAFDMYDTGSFDASDAKDLGMTNPFVFFNMARAIAGEQAALKTSESIKGFYKRFQANLYLADIKMYQTSEMKRLYIAQKWAVEQGFTAAAIYELIDNFGSMLEDIIKDQIETGLFTKVLEFVAGLTPIGRALVLAYEVYQALQTASAVKDVLVLVGEVLLILDEAEDSTSIVTTQRSAAKLTVAAEQLIPLIIQLISAHLAKRFREKTKHHGEKSGGGATHEPGGTHEGGGKGAHDQAGEHEKGTGHDDPAAKGHEHDDPAGKGHEGEDAADAPPEKNRKELLDEAPSSGRPKEPVLDAELKSAEGGVIKKSSVPGYDAEVNLPNGHTYRRQNGKWCRFSPPNPSACFLPGHEPKLINDDLQELEQKAKDFEKEKPPEGGHEMPPKVHEDLMKALPDGASDAQKQRWSQMVERAGHADIGLDEAEAAKFLKSKNLDEALDDLEEHINARAVAHTEKLLGVSKDNPEPGMREDPGDSTKVARGEPGYGKGGLKLPKLGADWLDQGMSHIPGQVSRKMNGMSFKGWDDFRQTLWKLVSADPELSKSSYLDKASLQEDRIKAGKAPYTKTVDAIGKGSNAKYQIDHGEPIYIGGDVYDMDTMMIVTPVVHDFLSH